MGIEGDGGAVPFEEYVDIDNDLITFEVPNEEEIIESLAEGDRVVSSDSDNQVLEIAQGENESRISYLEGLKVLDKLRRFCIQEDFDYSPVTECICSLEKFTNSKLYSKQLKISDFFH